MIGIFSDVFVPESKAAAIRNFHIAMALHENVGLPVIVHTSTRTRETYNFKVVKNFIPAPSSESDTPTRLMMEFLLGAEMFIRILVSRYKLILLSSPPFMSSVLGASSAWLRGIPYIFDVRDEYPEVYFTARLINRRRILGRFLSKVERFVYRRALLVTTVTEGIVNRIHERYPELELYLLRNGFDEKAFFPSTIKSDVFTIVFHGNIGKFQRPDLLIELATLAEKRGLPYKFQIIGWGNNDQDLKSNTLSNLEYCGKIDYEKIPTMISKAQVGVSFRTSDSISANSFPVKLYEYIGVGLPMIVTPKSEAGEFVEENKIGYQFSGDDVAEILNQIELLHNNSQKLQGLIQNVIQIRPVFSRREINAKFAKLILNRIQAS